MNRRIQRLLRRRAAIKEQIDAIDDAIASSTSEMMKVRRAVICASSDLLLARLATVRCRLGEVTR